MKKNAEAHLSKVYIRLSPFCSRSRFSFEIIISDLNEWSHHFLRPAQLLTGMPIAINRVQIMFCLPYKHFGSPTLKIWQTMRTSRIVILLLHHHEYEYCRMECVCISYKLGICFCHRTKLRSGLTILAIDAVALVTTSNTESHTAPNLETFLWLFVNTPVAGKSES